MLQEIYIIDNEAEIVEPLKEAFKNEEEYKIKGIKTENIDVALKSIPALIIINEDSIDQDIINLCNRIREDDDNSITPIVVLSTNWDKEHRIEILKLCVEYYILKPVDIDYLYYTIKNIVRLMYNNRRISPLTGLPGNVQIQTEIKKRLLKKEEFAILYFDLDNFKAFNDLYGFTKGDEIIKFTARTISKNIHSCEAESSFVGHIGGDDFIAIVSGVDYEQICKNVVKEFDEKVLYFFTEEDRERGYVEVANRKGIMEQFPLTSISIGVVDAEIGRFKNALEIGEIGAQVKNLAKTMVGSSYAINRRKK